MCRTAIVFGITNGSLELWRYMRLDAMSNQLVWRRTSRPPVNSFWIDSGGYQIMIKGLKVKLEAVLKRYREIDADYFISLDIPPNDMCSISRELVYENIRNFEYLYERLEGKTIIPVIHCYQVDLIFEALDAYRRYNVKMLAYGGAVPPTLGKLGRNSKKIPFVGLAILRKVFNGWIHALGIGGAFTTYLALKQLGINSFDSSSWRTKAAYGKVLIPGLGERYVGNGSARFGRIDLKPHEKELLVKYLEKSSFPLLDKLDELLAKFEGRALINAWLLYNFADNVQELSGSKWMVKLSAKLRNMSLDDAVEMFEKMAQHPKNPESRSRMQSVNVRIIRYS